MKLINGWVWWKQWDKIDINLRLSCVTFFQIKGDWSRRELSFTLLNFRIEF